MRTLVAPRRVGATCGGVGLNKACWPSPSRLASNNDPDRIRARGLFDGKAHPRIAVVDSQPLCNRIPGCFHRGNCVVIVEPARSDTYESHDPRTGRWLEAIKLSSPVRRGPVFAGIAGTQGPTRWRGCGSSPMPAAAGGVRGVGRSRGSRGAAGGTVPSPEGSGEGGIRIWPCGSSFPGRSVLNAR